MLAVLLPVMRWCRTGPAVSDHAASTHSPPKETRVRSRPTRCRARHGDPQPDRLHADPVGRPQGAPGCTDLTLNRAAGHLRAPAFAAVAVLPLQAAMPPLRPRSA